MEPLYETKLGRAYVGDSLGVMRGLRDESLNLIVTSPPFPLTFQKKKPYGTVRIDEYMSWFLPMADQFNPTSTVTDPKTGP